MKRALIITLGLIVALLLTSCVPTPAPVEPTRVAEPAAKAPEPTPAPKAAKAPKDITIG